MLHSWAAAAAEEELTLLSLAIILLILHSDLVSGVWCAQSLDQKIFSGCEKFIPHLVVATSRRTQVCIDLMLMPCQNAEEEVSY